LGSEPSLMDFGRRRRLRPAQKRGSARLGQGVGSPLDRDEAPIDVAAQDLGSVWNVCLKVPGRRGLCANAAAQARARCR
jgi:hypothetical protein